MLPQERLVVARLSYQHALAAARLCSSVASWRRLLTAARNLAEAHEDRERREGRGTDERRGAPRLAQVVRLAPRT